MGREKEKKKKKKENRAAALTLLRASVESVGGDLWGRLRLEARAQGLALLRAKRGIGAGEEAAEQLAAEAAVADLFGFSGEDEHPATTAAAAAAIQPTPTPTATPEEQQEANAAFEAYLSS